MTIRLATLDDIDIAVSQFRQATRLCVDTEFHAERRYYPRLFLVQVHVEGGDTWLLDPLVTGLIDRVAPALRETPWLVHAGRHDVQILSRALGGVPEDILDVQIGAGLTGSRYPQSYGKLILEYLQTDIDKSHTLSDWSRRPLSSQQIEYAAADVQLLPALWSVIRDALIAHDRLETCRDACKDAQNQHLDPDTEASQWRKLQAVSVLSGPSVCALRALSRWRVDKARDANQPVRSVLSDGHMVELSKRLPETLGALRTNRRFPKGIVKRHGEEIVAVIAQAAASPQSSWPRVIRHLSPESRQLSWFKTFALVEGAHLGFAASLALPDTLLARLVHTTPESRQALRDDLGVWRDRLTGDRLWDAMHGRVILRCSGRDVVTDHPDTSPS